MEVIMVIKVISREQIEKDRRANLRKIKPLVYDKIVQLKDKFLRGESTAIIDFAYDYACNLKCNHCCNNRFHKKDRSMTVDDVKNLSEQADQLGLCQFNISGGEPLLFPNIDDIIQALNPAKFHLSMSTNGHFLTLEKAKHLKSLGLDKVRISVDSIDELLHDQNRNNSGAYKKALNAISNAKKAGLDVMLQSVMTRQNTQSQNTVELAKYAQENDLIVDCMVIRAVGTAEGRHDWLINEEDAQFLLDLSKEYPAIRRDVFPAYGMEKGCGAVNCNLHVTKYGDVLPCAFIHIAIGNIFEEPLKDIIDRGLRIKHFKEYNPKCLSGEDRCFINNYMSKFYGKPLPINWKDAFTDEDFCDGCAK
jgi:MoaA/NifB/PqqE/SkfB family radical SAM enzyme